MFTDNARTTRAADLAERLVDEISEADQDWPAIELRVRELLEVVARLADTYDRAQADDRRTAHRRRPQALGRARV